MYLEEKKKNSSQKYRDILCFISLINNQNETRYHVCAIRNGISANDTTLLLKLNGVERSLALTIKLASLPHVIIVH